MAGRFNQFQRLMLQWDELHPYNAVHVVRLPGQPDLARLGTVLRQLLPRLDLTGFRMDAERTSFVYQGGPTPGEVKLVSAADPQAALSTEIEQQLNTRFAGDPGFDPFRFFVVPETTAFSLGLVYFHPAADAEAVVFLLKRIVAAYVAGEVGADVEPLDLYPPRRDGFFRHLAPALHKLAAFPRQMVNLRRSSRPSYHDIQDTHNAFACFALPAGSLEKLRAAAKSWGVTVNDLFLALLARSLAPQLEAARNRRRRKFSLGCIVNLRRDLGLDGPRTFGLFLGSFIVTQPVSAGSGLREMALALHAQTERAKRRRLYLATALELRFARRALGFCSTRRQKKLYQMHYPLWGGITNMNLNPLWPQPHEGPPLDYLRAVSTGPATPLVLSVTTAGANVNVGLTCRRTVFAPADRERIKCALLAMVSGRELPT